MRLTKLTHSCVRIEAGGRTLVIDPGAWGPTDDLAGAGAALITHEHADHFEPDRLRVHAAANPDFRVFANTAVAGQLADLGDRVVTVADGDSIDAAGFAVRVVGRLHASIHPDIPQALNVCFLVEGRVFHPGDSFTAPPDSGLTLLLPLSAPWLKLAEAIDYARAARPAIAIPIHDGILNERGTGLGGRLLGTPGMLGPGADGVPPQFRPLAIGESIEIA